MYDSSNSCNPSGNRWGSDWIFGGVLLPVSHPAWGALIEMTKSFVIDSITKSHPALGAWIEICSAR